MRYAAMVLILMLTASVTSAAQANCRWEVHGRMEGVVHGVGTLPGQIWPAANLAVRVQARVSGGWWNQANWPATHTDAQGRWSVTSTIAFADPDCQDNRQFRVQFRGYSTGNHWRTIHQQSVSGPSGMSGILSPAPIHSSALGLLLLGEDGSSENGVLRIEGLTPPPVQLVPADEDDGNNGADEPVDDDDPTQDGSLGDQDITIAEAPCGLLPGGVTGRVEFRFGQMPASPGPLSYDQALRTQQRSNGAGTVTLNRLRNHVLVENAGLRDYHPREDCPAVVRFRINEGPGRRGEAEDAWSNPAFVEIPALAVNATAPIARDANLLGSGDIFPGEWAEQWYDGEGNSGFYEYALIEVTLDATNHVFEAAEGDNTITHCYHAPAGQFVDLALCQTP